MWLRFLLNAFLTYFLKDWILPQLINIIVHFHPIDFQIPDAEVRYLHQHRAWILRCLCMFVGHVQKHYKHVRKYTYMCIYIAIIWWYVMSIHTYIYTYVYIYIYIHLSIKYLRFLWFFNICFGCVGDQAPTPQKTSRSWTAKSGQVATAFVTFHHGGQILGVSSQFG